MLVLCDTHSYIQGGEFDKHLPEGKLYTTFLNNENNIGIIKYVWGSGMNCLWKTHPLEDNFDCGFLFCWLFGIYCFGMSTCQLLKPHLFFFFLWDRRCFLLLSIKARQHILIFVGKSLVWGFFFEGGSLVKIPVITQSAAKALNVLSIA